MLKHRPITVSLLCILLLFVAAVLIPLLTQSEYQLVVYCAHDATFAESVIQRFERDTGIRVDVRFDEEANKSLGLTNLLIEERDNPRCDVFWNNQALGTMRLKELGVLEPYKGPGYDRMPAAFKDPDGTWTGFAARLRVYLVNTDHMDATQEAIDVLLESDSLDRVAIAQPLFGTTLSHYSVLMDQLGEEQLKAWHASIHERGIREVRGNSVSRDLVANGVCDLGFTDTDDAFAALDDAMPVRLLPVRLPDGRTICLPNTVAMIRHCRHPDIARQFIDYLLTEETELLLAQSSSRQIPLGPVDISRLSPEVLELKQWAAEGVSLSGAATVQHKVLDWLKREYTGQ